DFVHRDFVEKFLSAEAVIQHRAVAQIAHLGGHRGSLISRRPVIDTINYVKIALVLDDHSRAQQCCLYHDCCWISSLEFPCGSYLKGNYSGEFGVRSNELRAHAGESVPETGQDSWQTLKGRVTSESRSARHCKQIRVRVCSS